MRSWWLVVTKPLFFVSTKILPVSQRGVPVLASVHPRDSQHRQRCERSRRSALAVPKYVDPAFPCTTKCLAFTPTCTKARKHWYYTLSLTWKKSHIECIRTVVHLAVACALHCKFILEWTLVSRPVVDTAQTWQSANSITHKIRSGRYKAQRWLAPYPPSRLSAVPFAVRIFVLKVSCN